MPRSIEHAAARVQKLTDLSRRFDPFRDPVAFPMGKSMRILRFLGRARRHLWRLSEGGVCCGDRRSYGFSGKCHCQLTCEARLDKLVAANMSRRNAFALSQYCEHSEEWQLVQIAAATARDLDVSLRDLISAVRNST